MWRSLRGKSHGDKAGITPPRELETAPIRDLGRIELTPCLGVAVCRCNRRPFRRYVVAKHAKIMRISTWI
jgi:hypothetical protein